MFKWTVEAMELMNHNVKINNKPFFSAENTTSREDKIEFVDKMNDGALTYLLNLLDKFEQDAPNMPKDSWGCVKTVSLIAWCKRNDPKGMIDRDYRYGRFRLLGTDRYITSDRDHKGPYDAHGDLVDEMFHRQLINCMRQELGYFQTHDPHEVALRKVRDYVEKYNITFGLRLIISSKDVICLSGEDGSRYTPQLTLEQCNYLIGKFETLEATINEMTQICAKEFDNI